MINVIAENVQFLESKKSERPEPQEPDYEDPFADLGEQVDIDDFLE